MSGITYQIRKHYPGVCCLLTGATLTWRGFSVCRTAEVLYRTGKNNINPTVVSAHREDGKMLKHVQERAQNGARQAAQATTNGIDCCLEKGKTTITARLVAFWIKREKKFSWLITNLPQTQFSLEDVSEAYRLRWQIELLFKEWKSYANLRRFDTGKESVATGLIWAAIAAALMKRFICHSAQRILDKALSTRKTAMCCTVTFCDTMRGIMRFDRKATELHARKLIVFLGLHAGRAHPKGTVLRADSVWVYSSVRWLNVLPMMD